ncbi:MAG: Ig-like domain-containing protein [Muribaculaceae bacterium]|nr:Ig-like domain-containing protein [Muribaculaceae bacterium]
MKKFALMMALAFPLAFASCGDDNDETSISLDQTNITLDYGQTATLKASEKNVNWGSSNEYVAKVNDKGEITTEHVGTAIITATKDGSTARCTVTVYPTNTYFSTITTWGATVAQVQANVPAEWVLLTETADGNLMYTQPAEAYPWYGFIFRNNGLAGSAMYFTDAQFDEYDFNGYLKQYYTKIENYDGEGVLYVNATSVANASESAIVEYDGDEDIWTVTYEPVSHTKAGLVDATIHHDAKALYKSVK